MNTAGDAADQVVRYSLEAGEVALKLTGEGAKELAVLLYTILKEDKKTAGKAKLETLIRSGKPLTVFSIKKENMEKFQKEAKKYGILYYPIPNSEKKDGIYDVMVKEEDAPRINRLVERFKLTTVAYVSQIKEEIQKTKDGKTAKDAPNKERPERADEDKLVDDLLGKPLKKEEKSQSNPNTAKTEKFRPSENTSKKQSKTAEGTSKKVEERFRQKPSIREELNGIKADRAKAEEPIRKAPEQKKEKPRTQKPQQHTNHKSKKKQKKQKVR